MSVTELLGGGLQAVELLRAPGDVRVALAETVRRMVVAAHGLEARGIAPVDRLDLAAARAVLRVLDDVADLQPAPSRDELRGLLLRARVDVREDATARVLVCDLRAARTLDADLVIVLGLEQGGLTSRERRRVPARRPPRRARRRPAGAGGRRSRAAPAVRGARPRSAAGRGLPTRRLRRRPPAGALAALVRRRAGRRRRRCR